MSVEPNSIESILCEAIKLEYEAYSSIAQCHSNSRELNDAERAKLNELIVANKALLSPLDDELNNLIGSDYKFRVKIIIFEIFLIKVYYYSHYYRAILNRLSKQIQHFSTLSI